VDPALWKNKTNDPDSLRREFNGLKGREWLMKWLPARAYDNGLYAIFSNAIGMDDDQLKNGCSMIIDPFGDIIAECKNLGDDVVTATLEKEKLINAGGYRYKKARRPELYKDIISKPNNAEQKVAWLNIQSNSIIDS
jgi:predicted amidohydrolase